MSEKDEKLNRGSFLFIGDQDKAEWGYPDGYPYKEAGYAIGYEFRKPETIGQFSKLYNDVSYVCGIFESDTIEKHQLFALFLPNAESFPVGMKCKVVFDGTEYECEVKQYGEYSWYLGNLGIQLDTMEDTGEPFCIEWGEGGECIFIPGKYLGGGEYEYHINELKVYIPSETIHPMAPESLPQATTTTPGIVKQMPYLPNAAGDAPTAENFNQLVRELKSAGLMRRS